MDTNKIPTHIAVIMDGNGRWAKEKGLSRNEGHKKGSEVLRSITDYADDLGVKYLTAYAFSTENWNRPEEEVEGLMNLIRKYLKDHLKRAKKKNIKFKVIGDREPLALDIREQIQELEEITKDKTGLCICIALNYGGRDEIFRACKKMINDVILKKINKEALTEEIISSYLDTAGIPDPDLMIRTSGEIRTSNFLPWQLAYSEFYFTPCLWPEFTKLELDKAIEEYSRRKRRFGKSE